MKAHKNQEIWILLTGDGITLGLVTLVGFVTHGTLGSAGLRIFATFIPLVIGWLAASPFLRLYQEEYVRQPRELWRPLWAMLLAGPLACWLRGALLQTPILPIFVLVITGVGALGLLTWRGIYLGWRLSAGKADLYG